MELGKSQDKIFEYEQKKRNLSTEQMKFRTVFAFIKRKEKKPWFKFPSPYPGSSENLLRDSPREINPK